MTKATRITASALGAYAALVALQHGYNEFIQGAFTPVGLMFNAIGPPCQAESIYHACYPAISVLPNLRIAGAVTILLSVVMLVWAGFFVHRKYGHWILAGISIALLLTGGGFIPPFTGIAASLAGAGIGSQRRAGPSRFQAFLATLWPWILIAFFGEVILEMLLGTIANDFVLGLGVFPLFLNFALLWLSVFSARAHD